MGGDVPQSSTETFVAAKRFLDREIQSGGGVASISVAEAADQLEKLGQPVGLRRNDLVVWYETAKEMLKRADGGEMSEYYRGQVDLCENLLRVNFPESKVNS